jgi:transcriptional regulator with XRE-family HTH domain
MVKLDNPVRIARLGKRMSQNELAKQAGIARMTLVSIEEGSTRTPGGDTLDHLAEALGQDADSLRRALDRWHDDQPIMRKSPGELRTRAEHARSFQEFRAGIEESATRFAATIGVARATLAGYESGQRKQGMPDTIAGALLEMGCDLETVRHLAALPPAPGIPAVTDSPLPVKVR